MLECQAPLHKRKAPLLKTFWWRFCKGPVYTNYFHVYIILCGMLMQMGSGNWICMQWVNLSRPLDAVAGDDFTACKAVLASFHNNVKLY